MNLVPHPPRRFAPPSVLNNDFLSDLNSVARCLKPGSSRSEALNRLNRPQCYAVMVMEQWHNARIRFYHGSLKYNRADMVIDADGLGLVMFDW